MVRDQNQNPVVKRRRYPGNITPRHYCQFSSIALDTNVADDQRRAVNILNDGARTLDISGTRMLVLLLLHEGIPAIIAKLIAERKEIAQINP